MRAVRAAADMQAALPALNEQFRAAWGLELRNHIGVNTGEVIAGDASLGQRLVTGDAVNTAARLEQAAGAMETILGDLTYRLARDQIEVEPIPPLTLKGKAEPVPAYRLVGRPWPAGRTRLADHAVRRPPGRDGPPRDDPARGRGDPLLPAGHDHRRRRRREVTAGARVRDPGGVEGEDAGPPRSMPAVRRRRHLLADRRDRPERRRDQRRGPPRGRAREDRRRSRDGRPETRTTRARSSTGRSGHRPVRRRSSPGPSCSGGSASCSRRSPVVVRWWRSSTMSTSPRPPSSSCSTTCSIRSHGSPILLLATARRSCWRPGRSGPRATRMSRSSSSRSRPTNPTRSSASCWTASRRPCDGGSSAPRRATPSTSSRSRRCWSRRAPSGAKGRRG